MSICVSPLCSFPLAHLLLRLEQAAFGIWPVNTELALDTQRPAGAVMAAAAGSSEHVLKAYELLLSGGGAAASVAGDEDGSTTRPDFRLRLLTSAAHVLSSAATVLKQGVPAAGSQREAASLLSGCDVLAAHARRLGESGSQLSARFDVLADELRAGGKGTFLGGGSVYSVFANY